MNKRNNKRIKFDSNHLAFIRENFTPSSGATGIRGPIEFIDLLDKHGVKTRDQEKYHPFRTSYSFFSEDRRFLVLGLTYANNINKEHREDLMLLNTISGESILFYRGLYEEENSLYRNTHTAKKM